MQRAGIFLLIFITGILVFFVGGYWNLPSATVRTTIKCAFPVLLLAAVVAGRRFEIPRQWDQMLIGFLAASCGFLASWLLNEPLVQLTGASPDSVQGIALLKLVDALPILIVAFAVARLGGLTMHDLYLGKGKVKAWAIIGGVAFGGFLALAVLQAVEDKGADMLLAWAPWAAIFVISNGLMEEFHFRGLLLRSTTGLLGPHTGNFCIALFFALVHAPVQYTQDIFVFLAATFVLGLAWGYLIQRTEALWGAVLFHAGADLMIFVGIYQTYAEGTGP